MWWRLVSDYPHKSFNNCHSQELGVRWVGLWVNQWIYYVFPQTYCFNICSKFLYSWQRKLKLKLHSPWNLFQWTWRTGSSLQMDRLIWTKNRVCKGVTGWASHYYGRNWISTGLQFEITDNWRVDELISWVLTISSRMGIGGYPMTPRSRPDLNRVWDGHDSWGRNYSLPCHFGTRFHLLSQAHKSFATLFFFLKFCSFAFEVCRFPFFISIHCRPLTYWCLENVLQSRARHWAPTPMPISAHAHGFWVGMGAILLGMGGHGFHIIMGGHGWAWASKAYWKGHWMSSHSMLRS